MQNGFGIEWEMKQPNNQNENPNKRLQATTHNLSVMQWLSLAAKVYTSAVGRA